MSTGFKNKNISAGMAIIYLREGCNFASGKLCLDILEISPMLSRLNSYGSYFIDFFIQSGAGSLNNFINIQPIVANEPTN